MKIQFVTKKVEDVFEAALVVDGRFARSSFAKSADALFEKLVAPILRAQNEEGTEILVEVTIQTQADIAAAAKAQEAARA